MAKPWIPTPEILEKVESLAARGLSQEQIADSLGIGDSTLYHKKNVFPDLDDAVRRGWAKGISVVANSLFESAKSGNTTAQIFYLKCRAGWKEPVAPLDLTIRQEDAIKDLA